MADSFVSNAVQCNVGNDTDVIYGVVRNVSKQIRDVANGEWDSHPASGSLDDYDISAGTASGGLWSGGFPEVAAGFYIYQNRKRADATPDFSDEVIASVKGYWNGSVFAPVALDSSGRVDVSLIEGSDATNQIAASIKAMTGITVGGTWTFEEWCKMIGAYILGTWQDKSGQGGAVQELLDAEDDATVVAEVTPLDSSPYKTVTKKI